MVVDEQVTLQNSNVKARAATDLHGSVAEKGPGPAELTAHTLNAYSVAGARPRTSCERAAPAKQPTKSANASESASDKPEASAAALAKQIAEGPPAPAPESEDERRLPAPPPLDDSTVITLGGIASGTCRLTILKNR